MEIIHHHFKNLPSTNDWALEHLFSFDRDKITLVTAEKQPLGRGRYGRRWFSPGKENLYSSFCFFIEEDQQDPLSLTHVMAISIAKTLEERGIIGRIKWPNDILVFQKKIAGILCETKQLPNQFGVVIGVGLNINLSAEELKSVSQPATSMYIETQKTFEVEDILKSLKTHFTADFLLFLKEGFPPFLPTFRKLIIPGLRNQHIL